MKSHKHPSIFQRTLKVLKKHKFVSIGLTAVTLMYLGVGGMISVTTPWFMHHGDTKQHVDYVWRLYNGDLPKYYDGITYPPFVERGVKSFQQAGGNPPLYYIIHAPFVGPYLNAGDLDKGIAVGRIINLFIGVLCILAAAWAGWLYGGKRKELFAVSIAALSGLTFWFLWLGRYYALDALLVLFMNLTFVVLYKILQHGLKAKYVISLSLLSVAGMATKVSYIVMLFTSFIAIMVVCLQKSKKITLKNILKGTYISGLIFALVAATLGWFYYHWNYKLSGQWFRPWVTPETSRPYKSLGDVLFSPLLWSLLYARLTRIPVLSTAITTFAVAGYFITNNLSLAKLRQNKVAFWSTVLLLAVFIGTVGTQIVHGVGFGSINFRYLLPAIVPISLFLAYGLLAFERAKGQLVAAAAIVMSGSTLLALRVAPTEENLPSGINYWGKAFPKLYEAAADNHVPELFAQSLVWMFVIGAVLLIWSLLELSKAQTAKQKS